MESTGTRNFFFEVFYDGECPLCRREIDLLRGRDGAQRIRFTNIADPGFDPAPLGVSWEALMTPIHGRLPNGDLVEGVEVFRQLYAAVGFEHLVSASRLPGLKQLLDAGYTLFARNRLRLTGRCNDACELPARPGAV